jgi:hypothetical protein
MEMPMVKFSAALGAIALSGVVHAQANTETQAYLECGGVACSASVNPWIIAPAGTTASQLGIPSYTGGIITGINDLNVGGDYFNVSFTNTAPASSPFVLSSATGAPRQPLTGVDAGYAIEQVFGHLVEPVSEYGGDAVGGLDAAFITAFAPAGSLSSQYFGAKELFDVAQTSVGATTHYTAEAYQLGSNTYWTNYSGSKEAPVAYDTGIFYTSWTPVAAPELNPNIAATSATLLLGMAAVMRGRRRKGYKATCAAHSAV